MTGVRLHWLEMMAMASGEAACVRMFSKASYFDADRRDFAPPAHADDVDNVQVLSRYIK